MQADKELGSVPDPSMIALFKGLVTFLTAEAKGRGWDEITQSLVQVQNALSNRETANPKNG